MSLLQGLQNNSHINELLFNNYATLKALEQQNILKVLSLALNKSLASFSSSLQIQPQPTSICRPKDPISAQPQKQAKKEVIQILSDSEQPTIGKQLKFNQKIQCTVRPILLPTLSQIIENDHKHNEPNATSSENHPEDSARKGKTKQIKKKSIEKAFYAVPVPEIDEIQACYLPAMGISRQTAQAKRESLLERRVSAWGIDPKKQKRQIRMLGH